MNIKNAKEEIKRTVEMYLDKDEYGYTIPFMRQRPIFMIGAPGIGKTAIMKQIASELGIGLVSYSMTHHTRQSAIGLPFISEREYAGEKTRISEYTMSEILASVYDMVEETKVVEGILFLDEINCVSETLGPTMLQFLQYKTFGNRKLPEGWIIVTAGNPPQYNRSVREFDIATLDRLKCLRVDENYEVWRIYAIDAKIHGAITAFLEVNRNWFYSIKAGRDGQEYVTARGWEDLSDALKVYEKKGFPVQVQLIEQYIADQEISRKFAVYYDLYIKYRKHYRIDEILNGDDCNDVIKLAQNATFDERVAVTELIIEALSQDFSNVLYQQERLEREAVSLRAIKKRISEDTCVIADELQGEINEQKTELLRQEKANNLNADKKRLIIAVIAQLEKDQDIAGDQTEPKKQFEGIKRDFDKRARKQAKDVERTGERLERGFAFAESAWGEGQEITYLITCLTNGAKSSEYISRWGSDAYYKYNKRILVMDEHDKLQKEIEDKLKL